MPEAERRAVGTIHSPHTVYALLAPKSLRLKNERAWMLLLLRDYTLAVESVIGEGSRDEVEIDLEWSLSCAQTPQTPYCVLGHNHPNGHAWPSVADVELTRSMMRAAARRRVIMLDHIVLGRDQYFSFTEGQLWQVTRTRTRS